MFCEWNKNHEDIDYILLISSLIGISKSVKTAAQVLTLLFVKFGTLSANKLTYIHGFGKRGDIVRKLKCGY